MEDVIWSLQIKDGFDYWKSQESRYKLKSKTAYYQQLNILLHTTKEFKNMKKRNSFNRNNVYRETEKLPAGGYIIKILNAKEEVFSWGSRLAIAFDIAEGEYAGFYDRNFKEQTSEDKKWKGVYRLYIPKEDGSEKDEWTQKRFNTAIVNIEDSNDGFLWDWDETKLKGKIVGALFNNKEYEMNGRKGFFTNCHSLVPVEAIRSGNFRIPDDTLLPNSNTTRAPQTDKDGFSNIPDGIDEEIPF